MILPVPHSRNRYDFNVLPQRGRVLGIDVGYSPKRRTTAFCELSWTSDRIAWSYSLATAEQSCREQALLAVQGVDNSQFISVAIDGPLRPQLEECCAYRMAECILSRGVFQKRGKPGQTNAGSGPQLHKHATLLARMVSQRCELGPAQMPFSVSKAAVYEAFPNLFLGVLCAESDYPKRPPKGRCWTDCLFPLVAGRLNEFLRSLLSDRSFNSVATVSGHEPVAALTCAITALAAAAGQCVAVGGADGYILLPPLSRWGTSADGNRWAERELRKILGQLSRIETAALVPHVYNGSSLLL